jgi:hypothetical protein
VLVNITVKFMNAKNLKNSLEKIGICVFGHDNKPISKTLEIEIAYNVDDSNSNIIQ